MVFLTDWTADDREEIGLMRMCHKAIDMHPNPKALRRSVEITVGKEEHRVFCMYYFSMHASADLLMRMRIKVGSLKDKKE